MYRVFLLLLIVYGLLSCSPKEQVVSPEVKSLMEAVYATGYVVAKGEYQVYAQSEGYLTRKVAHEGMEVKAGDPLFIIESDQQAARYRIAAENYQIARKNMQPNSPARQELEAARDAARTRMLFDSANFARYQNLWDKNATTKVDYDRAKLAYENAQSDYRLQFSRLEKVLDQLRVELSNAENQLKIAGDESQRFVIRSQVDGMVFSTAKESGELVRRGEVLAVVGKKDGFFLELNVDELDIRKVETGQRVLVSIDAYPDEIFEASVTQVYPLVDKRQQSARVDAALTGSLPGWFSGLALEANIVIREKKDALVVPKAALKSDTILVKTPDGVKPIKVVRGLETLEEVEILSGIDSGAQIIIKL